MPEFKTFRRFTFIQLGVCGAALSAFVGYLWTDGVFSHFFLLVAFIVSPSVKRIKLALGSEKEFRQGFPEIVLAEDTKFRTKGSRSGIAAWSPVTQLVVGSFFALCSFFMFWVFSKT